MVTKTSLELIRSRLERLRKDSLDLAANANRIVFAGVQRIADHELKTLNDAYRQAMKSLKQARRSGGVKDIAAAQLDAMQDAVNRVIASTREALAIATETRRQLGELLQQARTTTRRDVERAVAPARAELKRLQTRVDRAAGASGKRRSGAAKASKKGKRGKKTASQPRRASRPRAATSRRRTTNRAPSPDSRASRATSRAKRNAEHPAAVSTETSSAPPATQTTAG